MLLLLWQVVYIAIALVVNVVILHVYNINFPYFLLLQRAAQQTQGTFSILLYDPISVLINNNKIVVVIIHVDVRFNC